MTEHVDPEFELYRDPDVDGCQHCRDPKTCQECAAEDRAMGHMRRVASALAARTESTLSTLDDLAATLAAVTGDHFYREFYRDAADDEDAAAYLADARRSLRAFARIARERAARTEQQP